MKQSWFGLIILLLATSCTVRQPYLSASHAPGQLATTRAVSDDQPVAPGKFIPTFTLYYGGPKSGLAMEDATQFDLIDVGSHAVSDDRTWQKMKQVNPHLKIFAYEMGPGEYNSVVKLNPEHGWDWITANHGLASADRWTAIGTKHANYIQNNNERLMIIGNPAWQQYWLDAMFNHLLSAEAPNHDADGVFSDNTDFEWPSEGHWYSQGNPKETDVPSDYYQNGVYQPEIWKSQAKAFLERAVPWLADRGCQMIPNFGYMSKDPQSWHDLDSLPHPVFGAMEEGAFATPWGAKGRFTFYSEQAWQNQINAMRGLKHVRALMLVHGPLASKKSGASRLDDFDVPRGTRGWDVLWFAITSFLQGYDDVRQNAYLGFTVWGYNSAPFLDEFDPAHLNLGSAVGETHRVDGAAGHCFMREFEAGWAVVNPTTTNALEVPVPEGEARVLDHYTFEHAKRRPLVTRFNLPSHRGIILLKPGRRVGNAD